MEIKKLYTNLDTHLQSIPGIGPTLAPILLAEIGNINNFDRPSKLIVCRFRPFREPIR